MESAEDNNIQQKINSVTDLPAGYTPNLQSKWELLEASLKPEKKRRVFFYVNRIAVAALLLMIGGASLYYIKLKPVKQASKKAAVVLPAVIMENKAPVVKEAVQPTALTKAQPKKTKRLKPAKEIAPVPVPNDPLVVQDPLIEPVMQEAVALKPVKAKRFTEIDFNEPVITDKTPSETMIASQRFKFKIGFGASTNAAATSNPGILGLKKQLN